MHMHMHVHANSICQFARIISMQHLQNLNPSQLHTAHNHLPAEFGKKNCAHFSLDCLNSNLVLQTLGSACVRVCLTVRLCSVCSVSTSALFGLKLSSAFAQVLWMLWPWHSDSSSGWCPNQRCVTSPMNTDRLCHSILLLII